MVLDRIPGMLAKLAAKSAWQASRWSLQRREFNKLPEDHPDRFLLAVVENDLGALTTFLDADISPDYTSKKYDLYFYGSIMDAIDAGTQDPGISELWKKKGSEFGLIPTHYCARNNNVPALTLLLDYGADIERVDKYWFDKNSYVETTLLGSAAFYGAGDSVSLLIERGADVNGGEASSSPLVCALKNYVGNPFIPGVKKLLKNGADPNRESRVPGEDRELSPLELVTEFGEGAGRRYRACVINLLLDYGAHVSRRYPLSAAMGAGNVDTLHRLIQEGADVTYGDPLCDAVAMGDIDAVNLLIKEGADLNSAPRDAFTPLLEAVWRCQDDNDLNLVRCIITKGADVDLAADYQQEGSLTPLLAALGWRPPEWSKINVELVGVLIDAGADLNRSGVWLELGPEFESDVKIDKGTPLVAAIANSHDDKHAVNLGKYLLDKGADPNVVGIDTQGHKTSPLVIAAHRHLTETVRCLIGKGALVNSCPGKDGTPLMAATHITNWKELLTSRSTISTIRVLLDNGADPRIKNDKGKTALDMARTIQRTSHWTLPHLKHVWDEVVEMLEHA